MDHDIAASVAVAERTNRPGARCNVSPLRPSFMWIGCSDQVRIHVAHGVRAVTRQFFCNSILPHTVARLAGPAGSRIRKDTRATYTTRVQVASLFVALKTIVTGPIYGDSGVGTIVMTDVTHQEKISSCVKFRYRTRTVGIVRLTPRRVPRRAIVVHQARARSAFDTFETGQKST